MRAEPITCYRPRPDLASAVAAPPYDVFDRAGAAAYVAAHPQSFLAVDRPETGFAPEHDMYADDVYARAHDLLAARVNAGELLRDGTPCFYLYRQRTADHEQTGIVAAFSVDDYTNGVIRRHELTRRDKEDDRLRHIEATTCQTGPVFLAYRENPVLEALVEAAKTAEPLYDFRDEDRVRHTVWRVARPAAVESIRLMLEHVGCAYIVDGHHRAAAAARFCQRARTEEGADHTGDEAYNFFLGALFPASQLACAPYDRVVADAAGLSEPRSRRPASPWASDARSRSLLPSADASGCTRSGPGASCRSRASARTTWPRPSTPRCSRSSCSAPCWASATRATTRASPSWEAGTSPSSSAGPARRALPSRSSPPR